MANRGEMDDALKRILVPALRSCGFKGSLPNFRRQRNGLTDLLAVQHSQWGGRFFVEIARVGPEGIDLPGGLVAAEKVRIRHTRHRRRLGARPPVADFAFVYGERPADVVAEAAATALRDPEQWRLLDERPVG